MAAGLRPVTRNYRCRLGELDLVMRDGQTLVIVEVRYRRNAGFMPAAHSVDWRKQRRLVAATAVFVQRHDEYRDWPVRFDIVAITGGRLRWHRSAFDTDG